MTEPLLIALVVIALFVVTYRWSARVPSERAEPARDPGKAPAAPVPPAPTRAPEPAKAAVVVASSAEVGAPAASPAAPAVAAVPSAAPSSPSLPSIDYEEDAAIEPTKVGPAAAAARPKVSLSPPTQKIVYDDDAAVDEPTHAGALILVTATAQTDKGLRRKRNEDSVLAREDDGIFVVADGMGGYRGGEIASKLAVSTIERAFATNTFDGPQDDAIPRRASELARAIQMANEAIFEKAEGDKLLEGMGTTICAARFSATKQRLYVGHVGDSRIYCYRDGELRQMTNDHTMADLGVQGEGSNHLSRAVGIWPVVPIDILLGKPRPGDVYMLCSDGLTKMVTDKEIEAVLASSTTPSVVVDELVKKANDHGGKDNVSVIVVRVDDALKPPRPGVAA